MSLGSHVFDWIIDGSFFTMYEMSEISDANIEVKVTLVKHTRFLELHFNLEGWAEVSCDRCLDPLRLGITSDAQMIVKFDEHAGEDDSEDNDLVILPYDEDHLNIAQYLYEYAHLSLPMRRVHSDDAGCNPEMMCKLEQYLVKN